MERPTTGRRHMRAGSITVAELIRNRPTPVPALSRDDEAATAELPTRISAELTEPMAAVTSTPEPGPQPVAAPSSHRRPAPRTRQLAKIAGLGVATAVLCASVAAASIIATRRQAVQTDQAAAAAAERPAAEMTGEQALLPNLFTLSSAGTPSTPRITTELPAPNKGSAEATVDNPGQGRRPVDNGTQAQTPRAVPAENPNPVDADLVRRYYRLLAEQPTQALGLLDGVLRQSDLSHFVSSWAQVRSIEVIDVQQRGEGELLAVVQMLLPDGGKARVQQLLRVTESIPQRITGAEIVSAQRS